MVYTDGIHLIADTKEELHEFAKTIELHKIWYHYPGSPLNSTAHRSKPYYMLMKSEKSTTKMNRRIIESGVVSFVTSEQLLLLLISKNNEK